MAPLVLNSVSFAFFNDWSTRLRSLSCRSWAASIIRSACAPASQSCSSFHNSGFYPRAISCYQLGRNYLNGLPAEARGALHESWRDATKHFEESISECKALQEKLDTD